jgi:hypothetical protein
MAWSSDRSELIIFSVYQRLGLTRPQNRGQDAVVSRNVKMIYESGLLKGLELSTKIPVDLVMLTDE